MEHLLADNSAQTQVEAGDGHFPRVLAQPGQGRLLSSGQLTTFSGIYHAGGFTAVNAGRIFFFLAVSAHMGAGSWGGGQAAT
jgi:hypothetical protein